jgi:indole-3-glycerol phosphate synthase
MFTNPDKIAVIAVMNILDEIVAYKKMEVEKRKSAVSISELEQADFFSREGFSLKRSLIEGTGIIAEFKRRSPSKGIINDKVTVEAVTKAYADNGASGISVLTDEQSFGGTMKDLIAARINNNIPILRKDFMIDEYQLVEAKAIGADVILLIAACLTPQKVKQLAVAAKNLGLEVLLEIHNDEELQHVCDEVDMVGVNNRNLKTFAVDINTSLQLINKIPAGKPAISESGITEVDTIISLRHAGYKGFLIGENFMKQPDPTIAFAEFIELLKAKQNAN